MAYFPSGKGFYQPKTNYQPNLDAGLLARIRGEVQKRQEEEQKRLQEEQKMAKKKQEEEEKKAKERLEQDRSRTHLVTQIQSVVQTLPMYCLNFDLLIFRGKA